jgi:hypothetical protein
MALNQHGLNFDPFEDVEDALWEQARRYRNGAHPDQAPVVVTPPPSKKTKKTVESRVATVRTKTGHGLVITALILATYSLTYSFLTAIPAIWIATRVLRSGRLTGGWITTAKASRWIAGILFVISLPGVLQTILRYV